jgi:hypothetical protein
MSSLDSGGAQEESRHLENLRAMRALAGFQKKDEIRAGRGELLESLGAQGSVTFGFVVRSEADGAYAVRCTAAVTPTEVVLLDDEVFRTPLQLEPEAVGDPIVEDARPDPPEPVIARVPREGLKIESAGPPDRATRVTIGRLPDDPEGTPDEVEVGAQAILEWPAGRITVGFATQEGAQEAVDLLRRKLNAPPPGLSDPSGTMPA